MAGQAWLRFYAELNEFLPLRCRKVCFRHCFRQRGSVKDMVESLGVPHTEIAMILVNGHSVDFSYIVNDGDRVSVYPAFESLDIAPLKRLHPRPLPVPRFVLDAHLGRLAAYLRMLGFNTLYRNDYSDQQLTEISANEGRILLTRDRGLLKRRQITYGHYIYEIQPRRQLAEVVRYFRLTSEVKPFSRCIRCNGDIRPVSREEVLSKLPRRVAAGCHRFWHCPQCGKVYWEGTHVQRMRQMIDGLLGISVE